MRAGKSAIVYVDLDRCRPSQCDAETGVCAAAKACEHKVMKQIDGPFEPPAVFHDLCLTCSDCEKACPLDAVTKRDVG